MPTLNASLLVAAIQACKTWADQGIWGCKQWAKQIIQQCTTWADHGSNQCKTWADQGSYHCCNWWPCSWFCKAFYWVAKWVCVAFVWVAKWVCIVTITLVSWICVAFYWIAKWVCVAFVWIYYFFSVPRKCGSAFLMTDGSILMNESESSFLFFGAVYSTRRWWNLKPDSNGVYWLGTWARVSDSLHARKYFASAVMWDGRLVVCGGEYSDGSGSNTLDETNLCEVYDPVADTWTAIPSPPLSNVGDAPCSTLPDGRLLLGDIYSVKTFTLDANCTAWTQVGNKAQIPSEESWLQVPSVPGTGRLDGTVVTVDTATPLRAEKFSTGSNTWQGAGSLPVNIVEAASLEIGPAILLNDGRALFVGAAGGATALYDYKLDAWTAGPTIPMEQRQWWWWPWRKARAQGAKDGPAAIQRDGGRVLFPVAPVDGTAGSYLSPCTFFEFDPPTSTLSAVTNPPNSNGPTYVGRLLGLPSGDIFWAREDHRNMYLFQNPNYLLQAPRPQIKVCPTTIFPGTTIAVTGLYFNGVSQAVGYGDDYSAFTNYPIVRIQNMLTGNLSYCRTAKHQDNNGVPCMGVDMPTTDVTTYVTIPSTIDLGSSQLYVVANAVQSEPFAVTIG
jgi:hypothetical protein